MTVGPNFSNWILHPGVTKNVAFLLWLSNGEYIYLEASATSSECKMPGQVGEDFRNDSGLCIGA